MSSNLSLDQLTDQALIDQFGDLVQRDHHHTAALLKHIDAIDRRQLWAKCGYPSMFGFCVARHHMSESTAVAAPVVTTTSPPIASTPPTQVASPKPAARPVPPAPRRAPDPEPLAPGRYKLQLTLDEGTHKKLKQLQNLLAHQVPNGDPAAIVARALDALLAQVHKRKAGITDKPRTRKLDALRLNRGIPAAIRREVWTRDEGCCSFVGEDGHRCGETRGLEFAHAKPWAKGGDHSVDNLCLRCRAHNAWEADRDYGAGFMATKRGKPWEVREPVASVSYAGRVGLVCERPNHRSRGSCDMPQNRERRC